MKMNVIRALTVVGLVAVSASAHAQCAWWAFLL
jgi:hypothetical protein